MHFFDIGDVESPDGRSHIVNALIPARLVETPKASGDCSQYSVGSVAWQRCQVQNQITAGIAGSSAPSQGGSGPTPDPASGGGIVEKITQAVAGTHATARVVVIIIGIGILLIVAFRLTK
jgi:type IV secretory pathway VirB2 component (pilin)